MGFSKREKMKGENRLGRLEENKKEESGRIRSNERVTEKERGKGGNGRGKDDMVL